MKRSDFHYQLPEELIAQYPLANRSDSRLLRMGRQDGNIQDDQFSSLPGLLRKGDLLIFNDTRVIPARLYGHKQSGGKVEMLVERIASERRAIAQVRASKSPKPGTLIVLEGGDILRVTGREEDFFVLETVTDTVFAEILEREGHMPLPPYIHRDDEGADRERYQTVYAHQPGAVAAPTAGLHFTETMLAELSGLGVETGFVTLHVGAGTFQPVRAESIMDHRMHKEWFNVGERLCAQVQATREQGGRIIAVGTTVVRCLESAVVDGQLQATTAETDIFIYPGYDYRIIDGLVTNFHLPESTLLMLVSAFAGQDNVLRAYEHAVAERYRFFSYGDAMLII